MRTLLIFSLLLGCKGTESPPKAVESKPSLSAVRAEPPLEVSLSDVGDEYQRNAVRANRQYGNGRRLLFDGMVSDIKEEGGTIYVGLIIPTVVCKMRANQEDTITQLTAMQSKVIMSGEAIEYSHQAMIMKECVIERHWSLIKQEEPQRVEPLPEWLKVKKK